LEATRDLTRTLEAEPDTEFLSSGDAARILDCSPDLVRYLEKTGRLDAQRTAGGLRLFDAVQVRALAQRRREKAAGEGG